MKSCADRSPGIERRAAQGIASWRRAALFACALGLGLLLAFLCPRLLNFMENHGGHMVMGSLASDSGIPWPFVARIAAFFVAAVFVHCLFGLAALGLTALTEQARPALAASRMGVVFLWFTTLSFWMVGANATWYPYSVFSMHYRTAAKFQMGPWTVFEVFSTALGLAIAGLLALGTLRVAATMSRRRLSLASVVAVVAVLGGIALIRIAPARSTTASSPQNVIIIGIDSLRLDLLGKFGGAGDTPTLDALLNDAHTFRDATTPLARTFPAWVSILTGRHPRTTGAWFNLIERESIRANPTLADRLRSLGYRTTFATDEVRFSNIDESYGFDQLITPVIGASDFILTSIGDIPLVNLVTNTPAGGFLFADRHANRGAASAYRPQTFIDRLDDELDVSGPTFLAVHLTTPHWPYYWADGPHGPLSRPEFDLYRASVRLADWQLHEILNVLRKKGALDNVLLVLLSDHGEAMHRPNDRLIALSNDKDVLDRTVAYTKGHGTSVLSPTQFQVLLAFAGFGATRARISPNLSAIPSSLEDVVPTVLDLIGAESAPEEFDGMSLASVVSGASDAPATVNERIRFTETDFNLSRVLAGDINIKWLAMRSTKYYRVDSRSGWVEIRPDRLPEMMALKERAAIQGQWLLAALPATEGQTIYALVNRESGQARLVDSSPDALTHPQAAELMSALWRRFPGELPSPAN